MDQAADTYPTAADFDYTFSDGELQDILGFLETQHQHSDGLTPTPDSLALLDGTSGNAGLQFQPHSAESLGLQTPSHSGDSQSGEPEIKRENSFLQSSQAGQVPLAGTVPQYTAPPTQAQQLQPQQQQQAPFGSTAMPYQSQRTYSGIPGEVKVTASQAARVRGARLLMPY